MPGRFTFTLKLATPPVAFSGLDGFAASVAVPGLLSSESVTGFVAVGTWLPKLSRTCTVTAWESSAVTLPGCAVMASCAGAPGVAVARNVIGVSAKAVALIV